MEILTWLIVHRKKLVNAILGLAVAFLLSWGITLSNLNKKLSEGLEIAQNNIEAYLGSLQESLLANNVLKLDISELHNLNDKLLHQMDSVMELLDIKSKNVKTAATQTQSIVVSDRKGTEEDLSIVLKDSIYKDSINYNSNTTIYYTISKDTVEVALNIKNTQFLFVYSKKEYKNKKSFLKRIFTLDFKKIRKYKYEIVNTNPLINLSDVRVIESIN